MVAPWVVDNGQYAGNDLPRGEVLQSRHSLYGVLPDHVHGCVLENMVTLQCVRIVISIQQRVVRTHLQIRRGRGGKERRHPSNQHLELLLLHRSRHLRR